MRATIEGVVMGVNDVKKEYNGQKKEYKSALLFQQGQKKLVEVKEVDSLTLEPGEEVALECRLFPWANKAGFADISCKYISD